MDKKSKTECSEFRNGQSFDMNGTIGHSQFNESIALLEASKVAVMHFQNLSELCPCDGFNQSLNCSSVLSERNEGAKSCSSDAENISSVTCTDLDDKSFSLESNILDQTGKESIEPDSRSLSSLEYQKKEDSKNYEVDMMVNQEDGKQQCKRMLHLNHEEHCTIKRPSKRKRTVDMPMSRQKVETRIRELRDVIPDAKKCSIDGLLAKTIDYIMFLHSLEQQLECQSYKSKLKVSGNKSKVPMRQNLEHGTGVVIDMDSPGQERACPVILKDLGQSGKMLVEIICDQISYFNKFVESMRSLGLVILHGRLVQKDKHAWAQFVVKGSQEIHRTELLLSLANMVESCTPRKVAGFGVQ